MHNMSESLEKSIIDLLKKEYPKDFSIEEIADILHIHRNTISKYLWGLEKEGKIKISRQIGRAKMYVAIKK